MAIIHNGKLTSNPQINGKKNVKSTERAFGMRWREVSFHFNQNLAAISNPKVIYFWIEIKGDLRK